MNAPPPAPAAPSAGGWPRDRFFWGVLVGQGLIALSLLPAFSHGLNPDGIGYIQVARRYLEGSWGAAVNGYWSPLISWLLVPLLACHLDAQLAGKLISVVAGWLTLIEAYRFGVLSALSRAALRWLSAILALTTLCWSVGGEVTPDLLLVALLLRYFHHLLVPGATAVKTAFGAGLWGGGAYLAKAFAFPYVALTLPLFLLWRSRLQGKSFRQALAVVAVGLSGFVLVSLPWAAVVSAKYGRPMFSTAGRYNFAIQGPVPAGEPGVPGNHPIEVLGLFPPPGNGALCSWEDPSYLPIRSWSPFASLGNLHHYQKLIHINALSVAIYLKDFSILGAGLWMVALTIAVARFQTFGLRAWPFLALQLAAALFVVCYCAVYVEARHIWIALLAVLLAAAFAGQALLEFGVSRGAVMLFAVVVASSFATSNLVDLARQFRRVQEAWEIDRHAPDLTGLRVASNKFFGESCRFVSYQGHGLYYGVFRKDAGDAEILEELRQNRIDRVLYWGDAPLPAYLSHATPMAGQVYPAYRIFLAPAQGWSDSAPLRPAATTGH